MVDTVQLVLIFIIVVLSILLLVLGIQVYFILKEIRKTIMKANKVLDDTGTISENISKPIASLSNATMSFKASSALTVLRFIKGVISREDSSEKRTHKE